MYAAEDTRLGRIVALKVLPPIHTLDSARVKRFQQEARAASALNHPAIVTIHELGEADGVYYIATELVPGRTLREVLERGPLPVREAVGLAIQIAAGLAAAEEAHIVHRDLKPENVMVRPDGFVKILDFGLAKLREPESNVPEATGLTRTGMMMGTARYMSPEQARGLHVDSRSDVFSFGVVLHEMLAGKPPFDGPSSADVIAAILEREPAQLESVVPGIPHALASIALKCLRKGQEQRYPSAQALLEALREVRDQLESSGAQARPAGRLPRPWNRRRLLAGAAIIAAAAAVMFWKPWRSGESPWFREPRISHIVDLDPTVRGGMISPSGRYILYGVAYPDGSASLNVRLASGGTGVEAAPRSRDKYWASGFSGDENFVYYVRYVEGSPLGDLYRVPALGGTPHKVLEQVRGLAMETNGTRFATVRDERGSSVLLAANADGSQVRRVATSQAGHPFNSMAWSPDGREIYYTEGFPLDSGTVWRLTAVSVAGGQPHIIRSGIPTGVITFLLPLPDGSGFVLNAVDRTSNIPRVWLLSRNGTLRKITTDVGEYQGVSMTRDGKQILTNVARRDSELRVVDDHSPEGRLITRDPQRYNWPLWTRGGSIVSLAGLNETVFLTVMHPEQPGAPRILSASGWIAHGAVAACPDRDDIVFASRRDNVTSLWHGSPERDEFRPLTNGPKDQAPQCLNGGQVVYLSNGTEAKTMQVSLDGGAPAALTGGWDETISPDGKLSLVSYVDPKTNSTRLAVKARSSGETLATFGTVGRVATWAPDGRGFGYTELGEGGTDVWFQSLSGGPPRRLTRFGGKTVFSFSWSPDGRRLVCAVGRINVDMVLIQDQR